MPPLFLNTIPSEEKDVILFSPTINISTDISMLGDIPVLCAHLPKIEDHYTQLRDSEKIRDAFSGD